MKLSKTRLSKIQVPFPVVIVLVPLVACAAYFARQKADDGHVAAGSTHPSTVEQIRRQDYEFTRPLILTDVNTETPVLDTLRRNLDVYLQSRIQDGALQAASIYLRVSGASMAIKEHERYSAGSLMKLPLFITFLKESEKNSAFLARTVYFQNHFDAPRRPEIVEQPLQPGRSYTVEELLRRMIVYSDNDATILLGNLMGPEEEGDLYDALHIPRPDASAGDYFITIEEYSRFFRVLYNSTYLTPSHSDYALKLLAQSSFKDGLVKPLGPSIKVPRKFGERGINGVSEFHEMGIVYFRDHPYLLGVMTKGRDLKELENIVADVSEIVYSGMNRAPMIF